MPGGRVDIRILGPLEVEVGGRQVRLGPQQGVMLTVLVLEAGRVVPSLRLIELLWGEEASAGALTTLRSHVRNLRRSLEPQRQAGQRPAAIVAEGVGEAAGYALRISPEQVDAYRFEQLLDEGRNALAADDPDAAVERLRAGLALWRGRALADVADRPFALREVARLEGLRRVAQQILMEAQLARGHHAEVVGELEGLVAEQPHDEGLRRQLALALYRSRRQEEAARVCQEGLKFLHDRGLDSSALQALQRDILRQAPELEWAQPDAPKPARPFQLPPDTPEFTGRQAELAALRARLVSIRLRPTVVISAIDGKPGVGKSALAIHVAHELAQQFPDGVLYVNLRGAEPERLAPAQVLGQFLRAFGVADEHVSPDVEAASASYRTLLADKRVLVVLDNAADAGQVRPLLPGGSGCAVLVTSRVPLVDLEGVAPVSLDVLDEDEAVTLLARIAGRRRVAAEPAEASAVVRHCGLLPLAVRIAGARLRARPAWPVAALAGRLTDERRRLEELKVGELAVRASFQLSYQSLAPAEARTFRLLGLLEGPDANPEVAAALTECTVPAADVILERLVDAQLIETPAHGRYRFHDLLRLFAREQAEAEDDEPARNAALERALGWYLATAEHAIELLKPTVLRAGSGLPFADRQAALDWLETERANLVAAAKQAATHAPAPVASIAWRLSDTLFRFFYLRKHWSDWQAVAEAAIRAAQSAGNRLAEAGPRNSLGVICYEQRRYDEAITSYEESLAIYRECGNRERESSVLNNLGIVHWGQRRLDEAIGFFEQSLTIARELGDRVSEGGILNNLGVIHREQRQFDEAIACFNQSLEIWREGGDRPNEGLALSNLGDAHRERRRLEEALTYYAQALAVFREVGARYGEGLTLQALGLAVEAAGHGTHAARPYWIQALDILTSLGAPQADEVRALLENSYGLTNSSA
jgi:DNA-binding SARP family transcriptional activator/tetratricopeptide (TPR) repeat protein